MRSTGRSLLLIFTSVSAVPALAQNALPPAVSAPSNSSRPAFLKDLTVQSFGYDLSPTGEGFEFPDRLSNGPFTAHGLDCPRCVIRPLSERTRYTLPPFGAEPTLKLWSNRVELLSGIGGINAWRADNTGIETGKRTFRRDSSFNDAWLLQGWGGARFAADPGKHFWFGAAGRYLSNFGPSGRRHWNMFGPGATFLFGH